MSDMREFVATPTVEELEAEIERLEADAENLRNTITSTHLSLKERDAEIERLQREWDEDLKSVTLQWEVWEESDKAKDAKIERLTHNLRIAKANYAGAEAEIERLRAALAESCDENRTVVLEEGPFSTDMCPLAGRQQAEIERLKAALEEIAERDPLESISASIARAALKGMDAYPNTLRDLEDDK